jgi:hypothetical protein
MRCPIILLLAAGVLPLGMAAQTGDENASASDSPVLDDLLKLVPDEVAVVVAIPDFGEIASGLQAFGTAAGIPPLADLDGDTLFDELNVADLPDDWRQRVRYSGPMVFALTEPETEPLLICTVTDGLAVPPSEELIQVRGQVLIAAPNVEVMQAVKNGSGKFVQRFEQQGRPVLQGHDFAILFDIPSWSLQIDQMLSMGEVLSQMGAAATTQPGQPNLAMLKWLFGMVRTVADESEAIAIGARLDADGIHAGELTHFERIGKIAGYLKKVRKSEKDPLRGLPAERGMVVFATEWTLPPDVKTINETMLEVLHTATASQPADQEEWEKALQEARKLYRAISGYNGVLNFGTDQAGMILDGLYLTEKPQLVCDGISTLFKLSGPMMNAMMPGFSIELSEQPETIGSVQARVGHFKFAVADEEMQRVLNRLYGERPTFYTAPHPEGVAYAMGPPEVARKRLEKLLAGGGAPLRDDLHVADALKKLSPRPQALVLFDLPAFMKWAMEFATMGFGETPPPGMPQLKLPETPLPYMGFGLYLHETSCGVELFFPAKTLKVMVEAFAGPAGETSESEPY